jgi:hypothetical protein
MKVSITWRDGVLRRFRRFAWLPAARMVCLYCVRIEY